MSVKHQTQSYGWTQNSLYNIVFKQALPLWQEALLTFFSKQAIFLNLMGTILL